MINILTSDESGCIQHVSLAELGPLLSERPDMRYWIDLDDPTTEEEEAILRTTMAFHDLAIMDCRRERLNPDGSDHLPKVEDYGGYVFSIINPIALVDTPPGEVPEIETQQMNVFLGEHYIVTHHYEHSGAIEEVMASCRKNRHLLQRGPDYIYHLILDAIVDNYTPILDAYDVLVEDLEDEIFKGVSKTTLPRLLKMKRQVFQLRRITTYQREMVYRLSRGEFPLITLEEIAYYRNVFDHLVRAAELAESYRDILTGLLDAYLSMTSNRLNEIMKVLAIISTFFLPLTFIAGVYGMNFNTDSSPFNMPELNWPFGYVFVWALMIGVSAWMFIYFRRRKWL